MKPLIEFMTRHRIVCVYISLISGIMLAFLGTLLHPLGEIDSSILIMCGQLLILTASLFGLPIKLPYGESKPSKFE